MRNDLITVYIGTHPDPDQRPQLTISRDDYDRLPRGTRARAWVLDVPSGKCYHLRTASCGIPRCMCALEFVEGAAQP